MLYEDICLLFNCDYLKNRDITNCHISLYDLDIKYLVKSNLTSGYQLF